LIWLLPAECSSSIRIR